MDALQVVNRPSQIPFAGEGSAYGHFAVWSTCLRQVAFMPVGQKFDFLDQDQIFEGADAYRFCLEVISGLHSPIIGETEVLGQFKKFFESYIYSRSPWSLILKKWVRCLLEDSKKVRERHLKNTGSQTYGSALRRRLRGADSVTFLGAGDLVRGILPWITASQITLVCREIHQEVRDLCAEFPHVRAVSWKFHQDQSQAVVCAAPLKSSELEDWLKAREFKLPLLIDLREDSAHQVISGPVMTITLADFFAETKAIQLGLAEVVKEAKVTVLNLTNDRLNALMIRPFGWEDLCV